MLSTPTTAARRLRVGLLLDGTTQPAWVARLVEDLARAPFVELALVVKNAAPRDAPRSFVQRLAEARDRLVFAAHRRLDERLFSVEVDAFTDTDIAPLLAGVPAIDVVPERTRFSDRVSDADADRILEHRLDVALRLGFRILRGRFLAIARHGVWSYHHADNFVNRGGPAGYWEVVEGRDATGSILQILSEDLDGGTVLYRSWSATDPHSIRRNRNRHYWKTGEFVLRKLRDLAERGESALAPVPPPDGASPRAPYSHRLYRTPSNREAAVALARVATRVARDKLRDRLVHEQWQLAFSLKPGETSLFRFQRIVPPPDRFWADPFPVAREGRHYVYIEEYLYSNARGHLAVLEIAPDGKVSEPTTVLDGGGHLSYPFVLEHEGTLYLIPEQADRNCIQAFRCDRFPDRFTPDRILVDGIQGIDPTIARIDDRFWLFANAAPRGASTCDELHVWHADHPLGPYTAVSGNPVKSDARNSRPAGAIYHDGEGWIRPAQDCGARYGRAIVLNRVDRLDERGYAEHPIGRITPDWADDVVATHTWNRAGNLTIIDCQVRRPRFG